MPCPYHIEVVHNSSSPHIVQGSLLNSGKAIPGRRLTLENASPRPCSF